jgi:hypothetical protein
MSNHTLATKLTEMNETQVVVSPSGEPTHLQIPWETFMALSEGEKETLEILSDPWWSKELPKRLQAFKKNPDKLLKEAVSLENLREEIDKDR